MSADDVIEATILGGRVTDDATILYTKRNERTVSDALAAYADVHGWDVTREVHVPGWGRLDLLLTSPGGFETIAVEVKYELRTKSQIRKGLQQADGYLRWLHYGEHNLPDVDEVILAAVEINWENAVDPRRMYNSVTFAGIGAVMYRISSGGSTHAQSPAKQVSVMRARLDRVRREVAVREALLERLLTAHEEQADAAAVALLAAGDSTEEDEDA